MNPHCKHIDESNKVWSGPDWQPPNAEQVLRFAQVHLLQ